MREVPFGTFESETSPSCWHIPHPLLARKCVGVLFGLRTPSYREVLARRLAQICAPTYGKESPLSNIENLFADVGSLRVSLSPIPI